MNKTVFLTTIILFLLGCASPRGDAEDNDRIDADTLNVEELVHLLPSPGEFLSMIHDVGLNYQPSIINPIVNPKDFTLYRNQALNFGVYLSDFSYLLLFEKQADAIRYLYHIQEMSLLLEVEDFFDDDFFNKILLNLSHPDTLKAVSVEQSTLFFNRMEAIGNKDLVLLITTGAIVESMFITTNIIDEEHIKDDAIKTIIDLAYVFDNFYLHYTLTKPTEPSIERLSNDLQELRSIFNSMSISQTSKAIREGGKLVLTSDLNHEVNQYNVNKMKVMVNLIRNNIVNQEY